MQALRIALVERRQRRYSGLVEPVQLERYHDCPGQKRHHPGRHVLHQPGADQIVLGPSEQTTRIPDLIDQAPELRSTERRHFVPRHPAHEEDGRQRVVVPHQADLPAVSARANG